MIRVLKALAAGIALIALVVGWPVALWAAVGNPWPDTGFDLSAPITDGIVVFVLAAVLWLCWAQFVVCVLVEAVSAVRGAAFPKPIPLAFGFEQHLARRLVGAVTVAVIGTGVASGAATAVTPAPAAATTSVNADASDSATRTHEAKSNSRPLVTVRRDDTLWALARDHLGDPTRWREISDLNHGRTMPDGRTFLHADRIQPGWQLRMPPDATDLDADTSTASFNTSSTGQQFVRVERGDTLSRLASRHLGSADRWPELLHLNRGKPQSGGNALTDPDMLQPGWLLRLPDDKTQGASRNGDRGGNEAAPKARNAPDRDKDSAPAGPHAGQPRESDQGADPKHDDSRTDRTQDGESGSDERSGNTTAPDSQHGDSEGRSPDDSQDRDEADSPNTGAENSQRDDAQPTNPPSGGEQDSRGSEQSPDTPQSDERNDTGSDESGGATTNAPESTGPTETDEVDTVAASTDESDDNAALWVAGGVGAVLATGLLGFLARQRRQQRKHRRFGERIALPDGETAAMESELRRADDSLSVEAVDLALRDLGWALAESGESLPRVQIVRLTSSAVELYLAEPAELPSPFEATGDPVAWYVPRDGVAELFEDENRLRSDVPAPFPSLVTLGVDDEGGTILVDLEQLGALGVVGDNDLTRQALAAMTIELATSRWADDLLITVVNGFADLENLGTGRIQHRRLDDAIATLEARARASRSDLNEIGAASAAQARVDEGGERLWMPEIVVILGEIGPAQRRRLDAVVSELPRVAVAAVSQTSTSAHWVAEVAPDGDGVKAVLQPAGVRVVPQLVTDHVYRHALNLMQTTREPAVTAAAAAPPPRPRRSGDTDAEPVSRPDPIADDPEEESQAAAADVAISDAAADPTPTVLVLGPLDVADACGPIPQDRRTKALEIIAYLALRPGHGVDAFTDALWPDRSPATQQSSARRNRVREVRKWLGTDSEGEPYLPEFRRGSSYELHPAVSSDWHRWCDLVGPDPGESASSDLEEALRLIRGRPFEGVKTGTYAWAQPLITEMLAQIEDCADELGRRRLREGRWLAAEQAASVGLMCEPVSERLYRTQIRAAYAAGNREHAQEAIDRMLVFFAKLDSDVEDDETAELLAQLREGASREQILGLEQQA